MTASSNAVRSVEHQPNLNEVPPNSAVYVIDFFEARHRLLTESERIAQESEIDRQTRSLLSVEKVLSAWLMLLRKPSIG
jgi:hypothetical protein